MWQHPDAPPCMSAPPIADTPSRTRYSRSTRPLDGLAGPWVAYATRGSAAPAGATSGLGWMLCLRVSLGASSGHGACVDGPIDLRSDPRLGREIDLCERRQRDRFIDAACRLKSKSS